jgi:hypothetical protein
MEEPSVEIPFLDRLEQYQAIIKQLQAELREFHEVHDALVNDFLAHCPESYEASEGSPEAVAVRYLRDLEQLRDGIWESLPRALRMRW